MTETPNNHTFVQKESYKYLLSTP